MSDLERALVRLGRELDVPEAPDLVPAVLARLERPPRRTAGYLLPRRRWALAAAIVALAALAATLAVPDARSALFRVLHIGGEQIEFVDELPTVETPGGLEAFLGEEVTLADARQRGGFDFRELGEAPDRVYLLAFRPTVTFLYGTPERPRLLVSQTPGLVVDRFLLKKIAGGGTTLGEVRIDGVPGFFLTGDPHLVLLLDEYGNVVEESTRLAGNVLFWEDDGVAFRLEGDFTQDEAVELAESLR